MCGKWSRNLKDQQKQYEGRGVKLFTLTVVVVVPSVLQIVQAAVMNQCFKDRKSCLEVLVTWTCWFYLDILEEVYYIW